MSRLILLSLLFLLSACAPYVEASDPYTQRAAADGAIQATSEARLYEMRQVTQAAAREQERTENEIARIMAPLAASQTALAVDVLRAQATDTAGRATTTAAVWASAATATRQAVDLDHERAAWVMEQDHARSRFWETVRPWLVGASIILAYILIWRVVDLLLVLVDRKQSVHETRYGAIIGYAPTNSGEWRWQIVQPQHKELRPRRAVNVVTDLGMHGNVLSSPTPDRSLHGLVHKLLIESIEINGPASTQIPSWERLTDAGYKWASNTWQRAENALEEAGAVKAEKKGTFLCEGYISLADLEAEIRGHHLQLSPIRNINI